MAPGGYREVIILAWPLFLSMGSTTILQFIDRMFLAWFSPEAIAAAGPSGMLAFAFQSFFIGMVGYASVFVAQYTGAQQPRKAVAVVWQALYLSIIAALLLLLMLPLGAQVFQLAGHAAAIQQLERSFFTVLMLGSFTGIGSSALSAYFIGRGQTRVILFVNVIGMVINIIAAYLLVFGNFGCPRLGIVGAALSTVLAQIVGLVIFFVIFLRESREAHGGDAWHFEFTMMKRLLRFGTANGVQFSLDMIGWTIFLLLVGRLGVAALAASNIAFMVNTFAYFPCIGFGMATSTLVGQNMGRKNPGQANYAVWSAIHISLLFTALIGVLFLTIPGWIISPFSAQADPAAFAPVRDLTIVMLRFVAAYCLFDVGNLVFTAALKGAGDIFYVTLISTSNMLVTLLLPTFLICRNPMHGGNDIYTVWIILTLSVTVASAFFLLRYLKGHWQEMQVIEEAVI